MSFPWYMVLRCSRKLPKPGSVIELINHIPRWYQLQFPASVPVLTYLKDELQPVS